MESEPVLRPNPLSSAHAELEALRERAAQLEAKLKDQGQPAPEARQSAAQAAVSETWKPSVSPAPASPREAHAEAVVLNLSPEAHDERMGELIGILQESGVSSAIAAAESTDNPHLIDDFHRILVEYAHEGLKAAGMPAERTPLGKALGLSLLEVVLPSRGKDDTPASSDPVREMHSFISLMEQFYRATLSLGENVFFSFEIANAAGASMTSAYMAVPFARRELFIKQLTGLYPSARINELPDDYNIFSDGAAVAAAEAKLHERPIFGLRSLEEMPNDPLDGLLAAFSNLNKEEEGAAVQFIMLPSDRGLGEKFRRALEKIREGEPIREAAKVRSGFGEFFHEAIGTFSSKSKEQKEEEREKRPTSEDPRIKAIERKLASPVLYTNIRIVASGKTKERAQQILGSLEAPFHQLSDAGGGNQLSFTPVPGRSIKKFVHAFSYRLFDENGALPLTAAEISVLAHLPRAGSSEAAPELRQEKNAAAPAPADLPEQGTILGVNRFRGKETKIYLAPEDRLRHLYLIGQTGTGKSNLLKNIILQDIRSGSGVCFIDPHGSDVQEILSAIPPERQKDVIYFDPGATERPMALNMLEYDMDHPEQKTLVVDELLGIFKKLFGATPESMGPAFEQYFRNSALLVMDDPESGNTLLDIARVFSDEEFRAYKLSRCKNPIIARFWQEIAMKATGDQGLQNYAPYITNKFDVFTTNEIMRPIIAQQKSSFNFRQLMDERKILLVNLAKGRIGEINANLLGLIIVGKFLLAALSRADSLGKELPPFYLSIDEFQNFTTPSIATILSEARKYKLSLTVAHQFIAQLSEEIRDAVFGNVGSLVSFRIGADDAEFMEKQFVPAFSAVDLMQVDNYRAFVRMLSHGRPTAPFNIETLPFEVGTPEVLEELRQRSALQYGRPRGEIEEEIANAVR